MINLLFSTHTTAKLLDDGEYLPIFSLVIGEPELGRTLAVNELSMLVLKASDLVDYLATKPSITFKTEIENFKYISGDITLLGTLLDLHTIEGAVAGMKKERGL